MKVFRVKKEFEISYAHRLLNYNGKCETLHGHNGKVEIILEVSKLNKESMVMDFVEIKRIVKKWLDENLDHTTILSKKDPLVPALKNLKQKLFLIDNQPTAEILADIILKEIKKIIPQVKTVRFFETSTSMAEVSYE